MDARDKPGHGDTWPGSSSVALHVADRIFLIRLEDVGGLGEQRGDVRRIQIAERDKAEIVAASPQFAELAGVAGHQRLTAAGHRDIDADVVLLQR